MTDAATAGRDRARRWPTLPCVAVVTERTEANLRWANNALTTNGEMRSLTLTVTVTAPVDGGTAAGTVSQEISDPSDVAARGRRGRTDRPVLARPPRTPPNLVGGLRRTTDRLDGRRGRPASRCWPRWRPIWARAFGRAAEAGERLFGFAELVVTTSYLGSSTGLRRRGVQPDRADRVQRQDAPTASASAWVGRPTRDFTDVDVTALHAELTTRLGWARHADRPAARSLRDAAAARRGGRSDDLPVLDGQRPRRRGGPQRLRGRRGQDPDRRAAVAAAAHPVVRPDYPGLETLPFVDSPFGPDGTALTFDLGQPISRDRLDQPTGCSRELIRNRAQAARTGLRADPAAGQPDHGRAAAPPRWSR